MAGVTADDLLAEAAGQPAPEALTADDLLAEAAGEAPPAEAPTLLGEEAKVGRGLLEAGKDVLAGISNPANASNVLRGLGGAGTILDAPGDALVKAPLTAAGYPTAGKVGGFVANLVGPWAVGKAAKVGAETSAALRASKVGGAETLTEQAGSIIQKAVPRRFAALKDSAQADYKLVDTLAAQKGIKLTPKHLDPAFEAANDLLQYGGVNLTGKARQAVMDVLDENAPATYSHWNQVWGQLSEMALTPQQFGISDSAVAKGLKTLERKVKSAMRASLAGSPDAADALATADKKWTSVVEARELMRRTKGVNVRKTMTEAASTVANDPARVRQVLAAMTPSERSAYTALKRAIAIQTEAHALTKWSKRVAVPLVLVAGGNYYVHHGSHYMPLELAAGAATLGGIAGLAGMNPRAALLLARGLKTPAGSAAAVKISAEIAKLLGQSQEQPEEEDTSAAP